MQLKVFLTSFISMATLHGFLLWGVAKYSNQKKVLLFDTSKSSIQINIKPTKTSSKSIRKESIITKGAKRKKVKENSMKTIKQLEFSHRGVSNNKAKIRNKLSPTYPHLSAIHNEQGTVSALITINKKGDVTAIKIKQSTGFQRLDDEFKKVVKKAKFSPAKKFGESVISTQEVSFTFKLK